ncbi:EAL domain-containing protein [Thiobacillus sp.]|uniref:EAL domain-containing protein n=1 Tax=Thiobacillus sp. TaxID=924 RepID=UPI002600CA80|nr:EAL domain-containing protein [Thiobacillus sp.]
MQRLPLRISLPLGLALLLFVVLGVSVMNALDKRLGQLDQQARVDLLADTVRLARMVEMGWENSRGLVEADLAEVAANPNAETVMVLDDSGRVITAHRRAWRGRLAADVLQGFDLKRYERVKQGKRPMVFSLSPDGAHLAAMQPFQLAADVQQLRSQRQGVVYVGFDLTRERQAMRAFVYKARAPDLAASLLLIGLLGWMLYRHVTAPLGRLEQAANSLRSGQLDVAVPEEGALEIARLAGSFNAMARAMQEAQANLATSEERLAITLHSIGDAILATDTEARVTLMNPVAENLTGWSRAEAMGRPVAEVFAIENALTGAPADIPVARVIREGQVVGLTNHAILVARDGRRYHIADSAAPIRDTRGELQGVVLVFRDVSEEYQLRAALANSELHFRTLANSGQALVWTAGLGRECDYFNEPWLRFTGRSLEQELGDGWTAGVHPADLPHCLETYNAAFERREPFSMEYRLRHVGGEYRWIIDQGSPCFDTQGQFTGYVGHCMDITDAKRAEAEIERLAYHDALTELPNRVLFLDRLTQALAAARRNRRYGAVLFVDLDQFKRINDVHGHAMGDAVLREVARRLAFYLRQEDTVARLGGDEFVIMLPDLATNPEDAGALVMAVAEKIRSALENPVSIGGQEYLATASIGVTLFPKEAESVDDLMREADTAMYRAKERGRNALAYFEPAMQEAVAERYALDRELREAVRDRSFELYLQSQVDADGKVIGAEALVRWRHPRRGLVMPSSFIPLAEESGLIVPLGEWMLREACTLIARLDAEGRSLRIAVNVSPRQFHQADFVRRVREILTATGADPTYLTLEITENQLVEHASESVARMTELAALGLRFAIDDFGTGYSSLAYLKRLPLSELKIDKSFVQDIPHDPNDVALVETILSMARHLHFEVVAEGVENEAQFAFLRQQGCERFQGYYFQRPQEMRAWIDRLP